MKIDTQFHIPRRHDRRVKYTEEDFREVKHLYWDRGFSVRKIAREKCISRRYIQYILFPERMKHAKKLYKERRKDGRYYERSKHTKAMQRHRRHKKKLYKHNKLIP